MTVEVISESYTCDVCRSTQVFHRDELHHSDVEGAPAPHWAALSLLFGDINTAMDVCPACLAKTTIAQLIQLNSAFPPRN